MYLIRSMSPLFLVKILYYTSGDRHQSAQLNAEWRKAYILQYRILTRKYVDIDLIRHILLCFIVFYFILITLPRWRLWKLLILRDTIQQKLYKITFRLAHSKFSMDFFFFLKPRSLLTRTSGLVVDYET